jgi:hypothetical protein
MAVLTSILATSDIQKGSFLNTAGATTGDFFALIDEVVASANDADYIRGPAGTAATTGAQVYDAGLTNMPSDLVDITSLSYNVRYRQFNRVDDTLGFTLLIESSGGTAYTNTVTIANVTTTTFTSTGATAFTLTSAGLAASKSDWDSAVLLVGQTYTTSMGSDNAYIAISAIEITGVYDAASTVTRTASSSGTGSSSASRVISKLRTASASATGSSSASGTRTVPRTATSNGLGSSTATKVVSNIRTASSTATGSSTATRLVSRLRTASASGAGSSVAIFATTLTSTASTSGTGSSTVVSSRLVSSNAALTGLGFSSVIFIRTLVRTASELGLSSSDIVSGRAVSREADSNGYGFTEKALWVNAGTSSDIYITIRQKNSVGFSRNDPRDQRILFRKR